MIRLSGAWGAWGLSGGIYTPFFGAWLAFKGRWGQPIEPTLTDAEIGTLVAAAADGMQLNVLVEEAVQYVAGSTTLQAWLSEVILPIAKGDLTGPTGPSQKGSWAVTPTFLPFGTDTPSHQCGTARFGNDPATSVLDTHCRAWDHDNLFVIDASFFPSSAALNPALTVAAQALRASQHIKMRLQDF